MLNGILDVQGAQLSRTWPGQVTETGGNNASFYLVESTISPAEDKLHYSPQGYPYQFLQGQKFWANNCSTAYLIIVLSQVVTKRSLRCLLSPTPKTQLIGILCVFLTQITEGNGWCLPQSAEHWAGPTNSLTFLQYKPMQGTLHLFLLLESTRSLQCRPTKNLGADSAYCIRFKILIINRSEL